MNRIENILDVLGTIRRLEAQLMDEHDPRVREEIAYTLDLLSPSLDREINKLAGELRGKK